jgi:hypothetical protein
MVYILLSAYESEEPIYVKFNKISDNLSSLQEEMYQLAYDALYLDPFQSLEKDELENHFFVPFDKFCQGHDIAIKFWKESELNVEFQPRKITSYFRNENGRVYRQLWEIKKI